jgi:hypothetical protein
MNPKYKITLAVLTGAAVGAAAMQGLHAQAKLKAYSVGEIEMIGQYPPDYLPTVRKAIEAAHGHALRTLNGRVVSLEGGTGSEEFGHRRVGQRGRRGGLLQVEGMDRHGAAA